MIRRFSWSVLASAVVVTSAAAQGTELLTQPAAVPVELAAALAVTGGFTTAGEPQLLVGSVPEWAANRLFAPKRAATIGAAFLNTTLVAVYTIDQSGPTAMKTFEDALRAGGWTTPALLPFASPTGFRTLPASSGGQPPVARVTLCSNAQVVVVIPVQQSPRMTTIALRLTSAGGATVCSQRPVTQQLTPDRPGSRQMPRPTVYHPAGTSVVNFCESTAGGEMGGTGASVKSPLPTEKLAEHYAKQLRDSGWTDTGENRVSVTRVFTKRDSSGAPVTLELQVNRERSDSNCSRLTLMTRMEGNSGSGALAPVRVP